MHDMRGVFEKLCQHGAFCNSDFGRMAPAAATAATAAQAPVPAKSRMGILLHRRAGELRQRKWTRGRRKKQHNGNGKPAQAEQAAHAEQAAQHTEPNAAGLRRASVPPGTRRAAMLRRATLAFSALSRSRAPVSGATAASSSATMASSSATVPSSSAAVPSSSGAAPSSSGAAPSSCSVPEHSIALSEVVPRMMPASQPLPALLNAHTLQRGLRKSRCHAASLEPVLRCSGALTLDLTLTLILSPTRSSAGSLNLGLPLSGLQPDGSPRRSPRAAHAAHGATGTPEQSSEQSGEQLLQVWAQLEGAEESDFVHNHRQSVGVKAHAAIVAELRGDRDRDRDGDRDRDRDGDRDRDRDGDRDGSLTPPRSSISTRDGSASASASGGSNISLAELKREAALRRRSQAPPAPLLRRGSVVEREAA
eukprot:scaffold114747_cov63-Phaeocystis_antarctica.AAC.1